MDLISKLTFLFLLLFTFSSCVSAPWSRRTASTDDEAPIENPFGNFAKNNSVDQSNITYKTQRGDQAIEVHLPQDQNSEVSVPMNPKINRRPSMAGEYIESDTDHGIDHGYLNAKPTSADHEIVSTFNHTDDLVNENKRREIETSLGLQPSDEALNMDESYLAKIDLIKQLFRGGRHEAALIEIDHLVKLYPTNSRLYQMRGTLLDKLGYSSLAIKSWKQALEFEPRNLSLKKIIDKRESQRGIASEKQADRQTEKQRENR